MIQFQVYAQRNDSVTRGKIREEFDWRAYLELYPDLAQHLGSKEEAVFHFLKFGDKENRKFPKVLPSQPGLGIAHKKLLAFTKNMDSKNIPLEDRTMIMYVAEKISSRHSLEAAVNNIKIFNAAVEKDANDESTNFYLFNVIEKKDNRLTRHMISLDAPNVAVLDRTIAPSAMFVHLRSVSLFKYSIEKRFGSVIFLSQNVRGPFLYREKAQWIQEYRKLLFQGNVGIVGPTISCEDKAHVQTHMFMLRSRIIPLILKEYNNHKKTKFIESIQHFYKIGISELLLSNGWNISSYLYATRLKQNAFTGQCLSGEQYDDLPIIQDPTKWCKIQPEEVLFYDWGGDFIRIRHTCQHFIGNMQHFLINLQHNEPQLKLKIPEVLQGGEYYDLYKSYNLEMWRNYAISKATVKLQREQLKDKVCLLVRSSKVNEISTKLLDPSKSLAENTLETGIDDFVRCKLMSLHSFFLLFLHQSVVCFCMYDFCPIALLRQTDPNWEAVFFLADDSDDFIQRLKDILNKYSESRIQYMDVPAEHRPAFNRIVAGYPATDYVLKKFLDRPDCHWISATNADNVYGSDVIRNVRRTKTPEVIDDAVMKQHLEIMNHLEDVSPPDMILVPVDSRNFGEQGKAFFVQSSHGCLIIIGFPMIDYVVRRLKSKWDRYCEGIMATLSVHEFTYTVQPRPVLARTDLASVFFVREKLAQEGILFSNFSDVSRYPCKGCQDGYLTEYLVKEKSWSYKRLGIDGLKSVVFHGPSPTWCIAEGHIWFDHPDVNGVRCYRMSTIQALRMSDSPQQPVFDWEYFDQNDQICLRFSNLGFIKYSSVMQNMKKMEAAEGGNV